MSENGINSGQFEIAPFVTPLPSSAQRAPRFEHKRANRKMYDQRELTWCTFVTLSTVSPRVLINFPSVLLKFSIAFPFFPLFYVKVPPFFHCFSHHFSSFSPPFPFFPIVLCHIPSFFLLFFSSFSPPLQSAQIHLGGRTRGESIPQRHPIATWYSYITLKKFTCGHLFYHLISSFLFVSGRSAPRPP